LTNSRTPALVRGGTDLDRSIGEARAAAIVMWRGEPIPFEDVPRRIAEMDGRAERAALFGGYREALRRLDDRHRERLEAWRADPSLSEAAERASALVKDLEGFILHTETPYFAALRRYLALVDIEQGDATEADLWHIARGSAWRRWFGERDTRRAVAAVGRTADGEMAGDGWLAAEGLLGGARAAPGTGGAVVRALHASLVGAPAWAEHELGVGSADVPAFIDFVAFVRLWRLRRDIGQLQYELRLAGGDEDGPTLRAYYAGILSHITGVAVPEEAYLLDLGAPFASAQAIETEIAAAQLAAVLESRFGARWWADPAAGEVVTAVGGGASTADTLAQVGYDGLDWSALLRQIRTRLIGEMSGYGGPNITTRAGTRKV
jgi:hypothetical protein